MDIKKAMLAAMQEYLLPELEGIKSGQMRLEAGLTAVNKRLDDVNQHLADQSRRIDEVNKRIDAVREELSGNINAVREDLSARIDASNNRIDAVRSELNIRIDEGNHAVYETNKRLDKLYDVVVRRDEHSAIVIKINEMDHDIREIKQQLAA